MTDPKTHWLLGERPLRSVVTIIWLSWPVLALFVGVPLKFVQSWGLYRPRFLLETFWPRLLQVTLMVFYTLPFFLILSWWKDKDRWSLLLGFLACGWLASLSARPLLSFVNHFVDSSPGRPARVRLVKQFRGGATFEVDEGPHRGLRFDYGYGPGSDALIIHRGRLGLLWGIFAEPDPDPEPSWQR